jgi:hypothetical protein
MGHLIGDRKAEDISFPAGEPGEHGDLYRVNGFTGFLINDVTVSDVDRGRALETAVNRCWKVKVPPALNPSVGDHLDWSAGAGFKRGDTDLEAASGDNGVVKVVFAKNANGYVGVVIVGQKPDA